jgi:hypothetical protein
MPRVTIDLSDRQHAELAAKSARAGLSVADYLRERAFAEGQKEPEDEALRALQNLLKARRAEVKAGQVTAATPDEIKREARRRMAR